MDLKPWKILGEKSVFKNRWWDIRLETIEFPDGSVAEDFYVNHSTDGVITVAVTEDGKIVVNRQYKHGAREVMFELCIGRHDNGEADPADAARRELMEETGYGGGAWEKLATMIANPTSSTSRLHVYLARGVKKTGEPQKDPREIVDVSEVSPAHFLEMLEDGRFKSHAAVAAGFLAARRLGWIVKNI